MESRSIKSEEDKIVKQRKGHSEGKEKKTEGKS